MESRGRPRYRQTKNPGESVLYCEYFNILFHPRRKGGGGREREREREVGEREREMGDKVRKCV